MDLNNRRAKKKGYQGNLKDANVWFNIALNFKMDNKDELTFGLNGQIF